MTKKKKKKKKKHTIPKTESNLVNWIRFAYVCIIFETTTLCYLFLTISCQPLDQRRFRKN